VLRVTLWPVVANVFGVDPFICQDDNATIILLC
jgi:hypothetical protein